jgi:hypothetical protein
MQNMNASATKTGPFTLHEVWDDAKRTFEYEIRHTGTVQSRYRYPLHAEAVLAAWNARALAS